MIRTSGGFRTFTNRRTRIAKPYAIPLSITDSLEDSEVQVGQERLHDGETLTLEPGSIDGPLNLTLRIDSGVRSALEESLELTPDDVAVIVLVEAKFLNRLDMTRVEVDWSSDDNDTTAVDAELPHWVVQAAGRTKITIAAHLVLANDLSDTGENWRPRFKGTILASWSAHLSLPSMVHWFTPKPLTETARESLNKFSDTPIAEKASLYVRCNGLLEEKSIEDALDIYLNEDLAQELNAASPSPAKKALECQIVYQVLAAMLDSVLEDARNTSMPALSRDSAAWPLFELLGESTGKNPEEVFKSLQGPSDEVTALRTHLQAASKIVDTSRVAVRKGEL